MQKYKKTALLMAFLSLSSAILAPPDEPTPQHRKKALSSSDLPQLAIPLTKASNEHSKRSPSSSSLPAISTRTKKGATHHKRKPNPVRRKEKIDNDWNDALTNFEERFPNAANPVKKKKRRPAKIIVTEETDEEMESYDAEEIGDIAKRFKRGILASADGTIPGGEHDFEERFCREVSELLPDYDIKGNIADHMNDFRIVSEKTQAALIAVQSIMDEHPYMSEETYKEKKTALLGLFGEESKAAISKLMRHYKAQKTIRPKSAKTPRTTRAE